MIKMVWQINQCVSIPPSDEFGGGVHGSEVSTLKTIKFG